MRVDLYDTTLRDGAQMEGISYSVEDKLKIARRLDELGVQFIEGGWPGSNPKDAEFFHRARSLTLRNARLAAFGSTRRARANVETDENIRMLIEAETPVVTMVGKSWDLHVTDVLNTTFEENLAMIRESVAYVKRQGRTVFYDAEHFFDGLKANREYALATIRAAAEAGADAVVLCDTNGGTLTAEIGPVVDLVRSQIGTQLGIHCHNDSELGVANSLSALEHGVEQIQACINGYGERCGNANMCTIIANLQLKLGIQVVPAEQLGRLTEVSRFVSELANMAPNPHQPYTGASAFAHKGGIHVSGMIRNARSYQHIDPALVGNVQRVLVSELSGGSNIIYKAKELGYDLTTASSQTRATLNQIKELENRGFQFEAAEASFELLLRRTDEGYRRPFELIDYMVLVEKNRRHPTTDDVELLSEATVKARVGDEVTHTVAEGNGPVNALDAALRKGLIPFFPELQAVRLSDYKVRILNETDGTGAMVRVLIESTDGERSWTTVGSSENIIDASWIALADSIEYWMLTRKAEGGRQRAEGRM